MLVVGATGVLIGSGHSGSDLTTMCALRSAISPAQRRGRYPGSWSPG